MAALCSTSSKVSGAVLVRRISPVTVSSGSRAEASQPADQTSYINYIKPLILAMELEAPHVLSVIDTKDEWYFSVHPQRMVPALKDRDPSTGEGVIVFESTACLQYLCERFDKAGVWSGRTVAEKGSVMAWTAYQTAALG